MSFIEQGFPETALKNYPPIQFIGEGGHGKVFLVGTSHGREHRRGLKVIERKSSKGDYRKEYDALEKWINLSRKNENLVSVHHLGNTPDDPCYYYVMDAADPLYLNEETYHPSTAQSKLENAKGGLSSLEVSEISIGIAKALCFLHDNDLVHRDVKPANILFVDGNPCLCDPSLLKHASEVKTLSGFSMNYTDPLTFGTKAGDQFALGRTMHRLIAGTESEEYPFPSVPESFMAGNDPNLDRWLNYIFTKACEYRKEDRYSSMEALLLDLDRAQKGEEFDFERVQKGEEFKNANLLRLLELIKDHPMRSSIAALAVAAIVLWSGLSRKPGEPTWADHRAILKEIYNDSNQTISYLLARKKLQNLADWNKTATDQFYKKYENDPEVRRWFAQSKKRFQGVPAPRGVKEVTDKIMGLKAKFSDLRENNLMQFYNDLQKLAEDSKDDQAFDMPARDEWSKIADFSQQLIKGIQISFGGESYLTIPNDGEGDMRLELWLTEGAGKPFDKESELEELSHAQPQMVLNTGFMSPVEDGNKLRWVWRVVGVKSAPTFIWKPGYRIWLRYFQKKWFSEEEYLSWEIDYHKTLNRYVGPLYWFNAKRTIRFNDMELPANIAIKYMPFNPLLEAPQSLRAALSR